MRPRFCLRTLLVVTALTCAACYWWLASPTRAAHRFARAIESNDYNVALSMSAGGSSQFMTLPLAVLATYQEDAGYSPPKVKIMPRTWHELVHRERRIEIHSEPNYVSTGVPPQPFVLTLYIHAGEVEYRDAILKHVCL